MSTFSGARRRRPPASVAEPSKGGAAFVGAGLAGLAAPIGVVIGSADPAVRATVVSALSAQTDLAVIASRGSGPDLVDTIDSDRPDLVFLDAQLERMDALAVIQAMGPRMPPFVFVAASRALAVRAFEMRALDFLVKPLTAPRVREAISRAREHVLRERVFAAAGRLLEQLAPQELADTLAGRIIVRAGTHMMFIDPGDIDWVESEHNHTHLHVGSSSYRVRRTIAELEAALGDRGVARIHRRILVRLSRIRELRLSAGGRCEAVLTDGATVPVSRRYRSVLQRRLGGR